MLGTFICSKFMWLQKTWVKDPIHAGHLKDEHSMHACSFPPFFCNNRFIASERTVHYILILQTICMNWIPYH